MNFGVPRERRPFEYRVGMAPNGVKLLAQWGHAFFVEHDAGIGSGFSDEAYQAAGATIVYSPEEAFLRSDVILKFQRPTQEELAWFREGQILMGYLMLPSARRDKVHALLDKKVTALSLEFRMCPQVAARCLENNERGGKGILLSGVPGVPPAEVVIIGAGTVGVEAARGFLRAGASVHVLDRDLANLQHIDQLFDGRVVSIVANPLNIAQSCTYADVLVSCVREPAKRAPIVVTREMVKQMRPRSLIMDISIDEGGSVETSRPTRHDRPTFIKEGVIHYCVPNMPSVVARTASHAHLNAVLPYVQLLAAEGLEGAMEKSPALAKGLTIRNGRVADSRLAEQLEMAE